MGARGYLQPLGVRCPGVRNPGPGGGRGYTSRRSVSAPGVLCPGPGTSVGVRVAVFSELLARFTRSQPEAPVRSTLEPVEPTKVRINVVVEPDELRPAIDRTARRLSREVRVPGFRKGKVPRQVIEARIGRDALLAEAIEQEAVPEFYAKAIEELGVQPLSRAQIDVRATRHTDEIPELTRSDFLYEVGSGTVVPKLDEELEDKRKGDILKFNATLPEEAGEELAGREVTFQVLVKEAKAKVLPKLDDDFAQEASEFDTLEELRADLRQRLEAAAEAQRASELETRVLQAYLDQVEVPLPESMVHDELHYRANRFAQQLGMMGTNLEQYLEALGQTSEDVEADLRAQAERAVRAQLVLEAVAKAEGFEASDEEVEAEIRRQAQRVGRDPEEVRRALADGRAGVISGDILRSKALAFMVEHAEQHDPAPDDDASEPKE